MLLCVSLVLANQVRAVCADTTVNIIPQPIKVELQTGAFTLSPDTCIAVEAATRPGGEYLAEMLRKSTGLPLPIMERVGKNSIQLTVVGAKTELGTEGYELEVKSDAVVIRAPTGAGVFYGVQTLLQLLPVQAFSTNRVAGCVWTAPCVRIEDKPRFSWRGLMLDTGHDFQEIGIVYRFIDRMALHKFNTFHWHITDLGAWPLEIKGYSKLLEQSTRVARPEFGVPSVKPGYYTQEQVREVVRYAAARYITVVPEIDMPGHATPALMAYPELDCQSQVPACANLPRFEYCIGNEKTYVFLQEVLAQVVELFPSTYIHIGGDECPKLRWESCPICQAKIKAESLKNEDELQSYFIKRIGKFLASKGRRIIGWDEILEGGLAPDAAVMSWRGSDGGIKAAKAGHDVVMAPTSHTYFDYPHDTTPLEKVYSFDPIPPQLSAEEAKHILGAQAQMWTDRHPSEAQMEQLVYPRACALAELIWTDPRPRDFAEFLTRLVVHQERLKMQGVNGNPVSLTAFSTLVGQWTTEQTSPVAKAFDWPLINGIKGAGKYEILFQYEGGKSRYEIHSVEIVQDGKVLAADKHFGWTGASAKDNVYQLELPDISDATLILRATVSTDAGPDSRGRILLKKTEDGPPDATHF